MNVEQIEAAMKTIHETCGVPSELLWGRNPLSLYSMPIVECRSMPTKTFTIGTWLKEYEFGKGKNRSRRLQKKLIKYFTSPMTEERVVEAFMVSSYFGPRLYTSPDVIGLIGNTVS